MPPKKDAVKGEGDKGKPEAEEDEIGEEEGGEEEEDVPSIMSKYEEGQSRHVGRELMYGHAIQVRLIANAPHFFVHLCLSRSCKTFSPASSFVRVFLVPLNLIAQIWRHT